MNPNFDEHGMNLSSREPTRSPRAEYEQKMHQYQYQLLKSQHTTRPLHASQRKEDARSPDPLLLAEFELMAQSQVGVAGKINLSPQVREYRRLLEQYEAQNEFDRFYMQSQGPEQGAQHGWKK